MITSKSVYCKTNIQFVIWASNSSWVFFFNKVIEVLKKGRDLYILQVVCIKTLGKLYFSCSKLKILIWSLKLKKGSILFLSHRLWGWYDFGPFIINIWSILFWWHRSVHCEACRVADLAHSDTVCPLWCLPTQPTVSCKPSKKNYATWNWMPTSNPITQDLRWHFKSY